jgi:hypothetical protein
MRRDFFTGGNRENRGEMGEERDGGRFEQKVAKSAKGEMNLVDGSKENRGEITR